MNENKLRNITVTFARGTKKDVGEGTSLMELVNEVQKDKKYSILAAKVNNEIKELGFKLYSSCEIEFIDLTSDDGMRIYRRSLNFVLIKAVNSLFPERDVAISHSISKGIYCEVRGKSILTKEEVSAIEAKMRQLVVDDVPFIKNLFPFDEAKRLFEESGRMDRFHAIEHRNKTYVTIYNCGGLDDYFYGYMVPSTGYIKDFALEFYNNGIIIISPEKVNPGEIPAFKEQKKLFNVFLEYKKWGHILGVDNIGQLNDIVNSGKSSDLIRISEALHEKKIANIADMITENENKKRIVLISGPSSSGKTTFAQRLAIQLRVNGIRPVTISLDDYFVDREKTPKDESGDYDFEALEAVDVTLFNHHLAQLIEGKEVEIPIFNFTKGKRESVGKKMRIDENQVIVIEGIHGLNEKLTATIPRENKFKIYVSALTSMNIDNHNRIPSTDTRIIRRIVRDFQFRGSSALATIKRWSSVRRGEEKNIFPYQEEADTMFNSSLIFELSVLKVYAEPLLAELDNSQPEYSEARRLIEFLSYFLPIDSKDIPANSIIKEFTGGSCFYS